MKSRTFACVVLAILGILMAVPAASAAPMVTFSLVTPGSTEINDWSSFQRTGNFDEVFHNNMPGTIIKDFHFAFVNLDGDATGDGGPFFGDVTSSMAGSSLQFQELDFEMGANGTGIPYCTHFRIVTTGFDRETVFTIWPTPEPATLALLALGSLWLTRSRRAH